MAILKFLEVELHTDFVEYFNVFYFYFDKLFKLVLFFAFALGSPFEDKELIRLLLLHDKVLSTDTGDISFILRFSEGNDLVWLPSLCLQ